MHKSTNFFALIVNLSGKLFSFSYFCAREKHFSHIGSRFSGLGSGGNLFTAAAYNTIFVTFGMAFCA
jgi:hypothetical protein